MQVVACAPVTWRPLVQSPSCAGEACGTLLLALQHWRLRISQMCSVSCTGYRFPSASFSDCSRSPTGRCTGRPLCTCVSLLSAIDLDAHSALQTTPLAWLSHELAASTGIAVSPSSVPPCGMIYLAVCMREAESAHSFKRQLKTLLFGRTYGQ